MLEPFHAGQLTPEHADALVAVAGLYGEDWVRSVVGGWFGPEYHQRTDLSEWAGGTLPGVYGVLRAADGPAGEPERAPGAAPRSGRRRPARRDHENTARVRGQPSWSV
ncbi:hypothetical protein V1460_06645 [Streptomyces sp. SCSIO 30461]|uniref:hypothetical protein n=1 Tax=Streptomyces sp. SCSIO 30461 TaxID=3118085 RepID=UPI0030D5CFB1